AALLVMRHKRAPEPPPTEATVVQPPTPITAAEPPLLAVKLSSDAAGKISLDGQPPVDLQDSQWSLDKLPPGDHTLAFESPSGFAKLELKSLAGALPTVKTPFYAKSLFAMAVLTMGDRLLIYTSFVGGKISLDGKPPADLPIEGLELTSLAAGSHELVVTQNGDEYKLGIETTPNPALNIFVESGQNVGTLVVVTGQDKAKVFLNGKALNQQTRGGQLHIPNLEPKEYVVRVSKPGFQDVQEQRIRIRKGQQGRLVFGLQPIPRLASLVIQGGPTGAVVSVDGAAVGT